MPKSKAKQKTIDGIEEEKIINVDLEDKDIETDILPEEEEDELAEEEALLDDEEINPFGDKWEE